MHEIKLKETAKPVAQKLRRLGYVKKQVVQEEVSKLLAAVFYLSY